MRTKYTSDRARELPYFAILRLLSGLPSAVAYPLVQRLGTIRYTGYRLGPRRPEYERRVNLLSSMPGLGAAGAATWIRRFDELGAIAEFERFVYRRMTRENLDRYLVFEGIERVTTALERGKGAILYSGHHHGMYTVLHGLGLLGFPVTVIKRERERRSYRDWWDRWSYLHQQQVLEERFGYSILLTHPPTPFTAIQASHALRRNRILVLFIDVPADQRRDVDVELYNQLVPFSSGSALLARSTGAPLIDFWSDRSDRVLPLTIRLGEPLEVTGDAVAAVHEQAARLDAHIRRDRNSWEWLEQLSRRRFSGLRGALAQAAQEPVDP